MEKGNIATKPKFPELEIVNPKELRSRLGFYSRQLGRFLTQFDTLDEWKEQARILEHHVNQYEDESFTAGFLMALYHFVGARADEMGPPRPRYSSKAGKFMSPSFDEETKSWEFDELKALKETLQDYIDQTGPEENWISFETFQILTDNSLQTTGTFSKRRIVGVVLDEVELTIDLGEVSPVRIPLDQIVETEVRKGLFSIITYSSKKVPIDGVHYLIIEEEGKEKS